MNWNYEWTSKLLKFFISSCVRLIRHPKNESHGPMISQQKMAESFLQIYLTSVFEQVFLAFASTFCRDQRLLSVPMTSLTQTLLWHNLTHLHNGKMTKGIKLSFVVVHLVKIDENFRWDVIFDALHSALSLSQLIKTTVTLKDIKLGILDSNFIKIGAHLLWFWYWDICDDNFYTDVIHVLRAVCDWFCDVIWQAFVSRI